MNKVILNTLIPFNLLHCFDERLDQKFGSFKSSKTLIHSEEHYFITSYSSPFWETDNARFCKSCSSKESVELSEQHPELLDPKFSKWLAAEVIVVSPLGNGVNILGFRCPGVNGGGIGEAELEKNELRLELSLFVLMPESRLAICCIDKSLAEPEFISKECNPCV